MAKSRPLSLREYLQRTRSKSFSIIVIVALLVVYEIGLIITDEPNRNAADLLLKDGLTWLGPHGIQIFHGGLLLLFLGAVAYYLHRSRSILRYFPPFLAECTVYALLLSPAILLVARPYLAPFSTSGALLDVGAGVYEEIVFRLILLRGCVFLLGLDPYCAFFDESESKGRAFVSASTTLLIPVLLSATAFAVYHHIGPGGDPWEWPLLVFRFVAGLLLAQLFFMRGLAVCVYAHAIYDLVLHFTL